MKSNEIDTSDKDAFIEFAKDFNTDEIPILRKKSCKQPLQHGMTNCG